MQDPRAQFVLLIPVLILEPHFASTVACWEACH